MGYAKTADLHIARPVNTLAALAARGTFLVRGVDTSDTTEHATKGTDHGANIKAIINEVVAGAATAAQGALADTALQTVAVPSSITATGTPSATTFLRGDGTWNVPAGGGAVDSVVGQTGTVTAAQIHTALLSVPGTVGLVAVAGTNGSGTWDARPTAQVVFWAAGTDTAVPATPPGALGDDIIILADPALKVPVTISAPTDTLASVDNGAENMYTNATLVTVTLANITPGFECVLTSLGAAGLTVAAGGMAFANGFTPKLTIARGEALHVKQTGASTFRILGGTAA